ncbi:acyl-CoA dehydrogenase [Allohahella marinimesophila]|uniref:Acyl-coenzyme A dehydrogenase n=1 Tax=Allohahella marinimesophila TaxID=1054972 RepID=A0ABP7P2S3_9GAMM
MSYLIVLILAVAGLLIVMRKEAGAKAAIGVLLATGIIGLLLDTEILGALLLLAAAGTAFAGLPGLRQQWLTPKLFDYFKKVSPKVSETERTALDAGTVGWDGALFSGNPDWNQLLKNRSEAIPAEEQAFIDHQCSVAVSMCNSWDVAVERADLPADLWEYLKKEKFFGMIIPKEYGGLGLSTKAQSLVLQKLAVNEMLMTTVGVPNSLGPGELLLKYGSDEQKQHYLPRLADGREIPCFGLTGPRAGSDATSLPDTGVVCMGEFEGKEVLGLKLNFEKRWITLAPIATVVGLAFRLFDPDHLLGEEEDRGITCALVPRGTKGMDIGRRHWPVGSPFLNGPIFGKDVFIPMDWIIGGTDMIGQGWRMLVECLSVGRCVTLPSGASGAGRYMLGTAGGFTRIRRQFNVPVAEMEGVQAPLARIASKAYIAQASVLQTANMVDNGEKPSVPSAILKYHLTEYQRQMAHDAMDVHGGKAVTKGPRNYLAIPADATAVSITVEGANILTRSLMIFGQGAIRCHPYVLDELAARDANDSEAFDKAFFGHAGLIFGNFARSLTKGVGIASKDTPFDEAAAPYAMAVSRISAGFGLCADAAMASLGSDLKKRELISARLGDVLSSLYLTSMVLKNWHEGTAVEGERALLDFSCQTLLFNAEEALDGFFANLPSRALAAVLRLVVFPAGRRFKLPSDQLTHSIARAISTDTALRAKLTTNTWNTWEEGQQDNPLYRYNELLKNYKRAEGIYHTVNKAYAKGELPASALHPEQRVEAAVERQLISGEDAEFMRDYEAEVLDMLTVDDFAFDALAFDKSTVIYHRDDLKSADNIASAPGKKGSKTKRTGSNKTLPVEDTAESDTGGEHDNPKSEQSEEDQRSEPALK